MSDSRGRTLTCLVYGTVILAPMGWVLWQSLGGAAGEHARSIFEHTDVGGLLANSILLALLTALIAVVLGLPLALLLNLRSFPGRRWIGLLYFLPLVIPPHIHAIAWTRVVGDRGWLTAWLKESCGLALDVRAPLADASANALLGHVYAGPAWIMACAYFPLVTLSVSAGVRALDGAGLEAARLAGGGRATLRRVVFPQIAARITSGALFVFVLALATYPVVSLLDTPALIQKVFFTFSKSDQQAGALLALPLVAVAALAVVVLGGAESRAPRRQVGLRPPARRPGGLLVSLAALLPLAIAAGIPLVSLLREAGPLAITGGEMDNYQSVYDRVHVAFADSLEFSLQGTAALLLLSYPLGRLQARGRGAFMEWTSLACLAFPPVVVGVALVLFWSAAASGRVDPVFLVCLVAAMSLVAGGLLRPSARQLRGALMLCALLGSAVFLLWALGAARSVWEGGTTLLVLAYLARFLPFTVRLFKNGFQALDPAEEEAARMCGHGFFARLVRIELPRMTGVILAAAVMAYVLCFTELAATLMVIPEGRQSVQIRIFNMIHYRAVGEVAALCVLVILLAALPVFLFALLGRKRMEVL